MTTINTIRARLAALNVNTEAQGAIESTKGAIVSLNKERMLNGLLSDGSIMPFYSKISIDVYGYPPGPWRLKNTGAFQEALNVNVNSVSFNTSSSDGKTAMLKKKLDNRGLDGEAIFGLDKGSKIEYVKVLRPVFIKSIKSKL